jgi:hypothetical protein
MLQLQLLESRPSAFRLFQQQKQEWYVKWMENKIQVFANVILYWEDEAQK